MTYIVTGALAEPEPLTDTEDDGRAEDEMVSPMLKPPDCAKTSLILLEGQLFK